MFPQSISLQFSHHRIISAYRVQREFLSFSSLLLSFTCSRSPVEITLIVIHFTLLSLQLFTVQERKKKKYVLFSPFGSLQQFLRQFATMIFPNLSTVLLASIGIAEAVNAYSPTFVHVRAALERRQVNTLMPYANRHDISLTQNRTITRTVRTITRTRIRRPPITTTRTITRTTIIITMQL